MKKCPKCGYRRFDVVAHVTQGWIVDENGIFVSCTEECIDVLHSPDDDDLWDCTNCGYEAPGRDFNIDANKAKEKKRPTYKQIYRMLHELGGCDADDSYFKGWDAAVDAAIRQLENMTGLDANCLDDDD